MTIPEFLDHHACDKSLLIGFYGGGNYGDELLMEVLAGLLKKQATQDVTIAYQHPEHYDTFHHDFGYARVDMHDKLSVVKAIFTKRTIIVGGGGLWGMDSVLNILLLSLLLFVSRWLLHKKVYLLAVGYYDSAPPVGRLSAWLAGKSANAILARDEETYQNFAAINPKTVKSNDIAWHITDLNLRPYQKDLALLEKAIRIKEKTVFISLRRFRGKHKHHLAAVVGECLRTYKDQSIIIALFEPRHIDPEGYGLLQSWQRCYKNVQILDFAFNPLALFLFFKKYREYLVFVGPQFHAILSAHLTGVPYLPLAYDNKVYNLLQAIAPQLQPVPIHTLSPEIVTSFVSTSQEEAN